MFYHCTEDAFRKAGYSGLIYVVDGWANFKVARDTYLKPPHLAGVHYRLQGGVLVRASFLLALICIVYPMPLLL